MLVNKKLLIVSIILSSLILAGCINNSTETKNETSSLNSSNQMSTSYTNNSSSSKEDSNVVFKTLSPQEFKDKLEQENDFVVIDVRTPEELKESGVIYPEVSNINLYDPNFVEKISKLDKSKTYFIYCRSGARSAKAMEFMRKLGFKRVYNLDGGIIGWSNNGFKFYPYIGNKQGLSNNKTITINAKRFDFDKKEIRVKQGEKVKLIINNLDTLHGIDIPDLNQGDESELILDTSKKGEYIFLCGNYCGKGHNKMKGKIIIE